MNWRITATIIGIIAGVLASMASWVALGFPTLATRGYVDNAMRPVVLRQLKNWRQADDLELFQWGSSNPRPFTPQVQEKIDELTAEIHSIDRQIAEMERLNR